MNRRAAASTLAFVLSAVALALACSKPPKTSVDVGTIREATIVNSPPEDAGPQRPTVVIASADEGTPAMNGVDSAPSGLGSSQTDPAATKSKPKGRDRITRAECTRLFDRFLDLTLANDPRFADLGAEGKAMVREMVGKDPRLSSFNKDCEADVSRAKYTCAMGAKTPSAWQDCVK